MQFDKCVELEDPWDNWHNCHRSLGGCLEHLPWSWEPRLWQCHRSICHLAISFHVVTEHMGPLSCLWSLHQSMEVWTNLFLASLFFVPYQISKFSCSFTSVIGMEVLTAATWWQSKCILVFLQSSHLWLTWGFFKGEYKDFKDKGFLSAFWEAFSFLC